MLRKSWPLALVALVCAFPALADSLVHNIPTNATSPLPAGSCMYVDQGPGTDTKLCSGYAVALSALAIANNLSDLGNVATARTNLGLGPLAISASMSAALDTISSTQGSILFRGASVWQALAPGVSGQFLQTLGAGANPLWQNGSGATSPGGSPAQVQWNNTGAFAGTSGLTVSATKVLTMSIGLGSDGTGDIYYNGGGGAFTRLGIGTNTYVLTSNGSVPSWQPAAGGGTPALSYGTIAGGPTAYTIASPTPAVTSNVANYSVLASIPTSVTTNTGTATLAVGSAGALPLQVNSNGGGLAFTGGEFVGNSTGGGETQVLLKLNAGATAWVMMARPGGGTTVNPNAHPVTQSEWANGQWFYCTSSASPCSITLPNLATTTLSSNTGINVATIHDVMTVTLQGTDVANTGTVEASTAGGTFYVPTDVTAQVFAGAAGATAYTIPIGDVKYATSNWLPGMDMSLATAGITSVKFVSPRVLYLIRCQNEQLSSAGAISFYSQTANGAIGAGAVLSGSTFDMTANLLVEQIIALTAQPTLIPAAYRIGFKDVGSSTNGAGYCEYGYR